MQLQCPIIGLFCRKHELPKPTSGAIETLGEIVAVPAATGFFTSLGLIAAPPMPNVRFGSKGDMCSAQADVRFTSNSGHVQCNSACPLCAKSGHSVGVP
jgi:hypothetical protein